MQTITKDACSTERTVAVDARDNHTYFIQKLADGQCWMLTNLAYAGGGVTTYGDTKTLNNDNIYTYDSPQYYVHANANPTSHPANPSTSTDGGATSPQYGYYYNWCAAMGAQESTSACASIATPLPDATISICPAGWRLPTGVPTTGEQTLLNNAVNGGLTNTTAGLRSVWLAQLSGYWGDSGFGGQGNSGSSWSSSQISANNARYLAIGSSAVYLAYNNSKQLSMSVRCLAI